MLPKIRIISVIAFVFIFVLAVNYFYFYGAEIKQKEEMQQQSEYDNQKIRQLERAIDVMLTKINEYNLTLSLPPVQPTVPPTVPPTEPPTEETIKKMARDMVQGRLDPFDANNVITSKDMLTYFISNFNKNRKVLNADKFKLAPNHIPIVIRVFNKPQYFKVVLDFYRQVEGIEETMIIVSHDGIFKEMFDLVESIDFCQVRQIIHPYSSQVLSNRFPGKDPQLARERKDEDNGKPRNNNVTPLKHHFWWHLNYVWDVMLPEHKGDICLLEEDHLPSYDFYRTLLATRDLRNKECPDCFALQMQEPSFNGDTHDLGICPNIGNMGLTFDRRRWEILRGAGDEYCNFDDYNWDWTLQHMKSVNKIPGKYFFTCKPRIIHIGTCGIHGRDNNNCEVTKEQIDQYKARSDELKRDNAHDWSKYKIRDFMNTNNALHFRGYESWGQMDRDHCNNQKFDI
ncbi:predicted protein [Heterostelium album PN500]|uniref:Alpha-1,6-mannosyl-glycoprotein 2-beta-N-acetylglucosaminyltransferase n=1 Tax=Heterostelium pallidum (strain ATCC 26659 / Pp 5 / PN500) TaxID=670386 RepID=D3BS32_HETP5|nr:predicted protein [Heterostelium album PN500]EFA75769.1 predicted protein [Heterostelium album PN500]|eukprot:XP_020427903.1 predicted protein [Heterostelium album PN500]